jgi:hypothetical protein
VGGAAVEEDTAAGGHGFSRAAKAFQSRGLQPLGSGLRFVSGHRFSDAESGILSTPLQGLRKTGLRANPANPLIRESRPAGTFDLSPALQRWDNRKK